MNIRAIDEDIRLYVLLDHGQNVLNADAVKFRLSKERKKSLLNDLQNVCRDYLLEGERGLKDYIDADVLRKITKDEKAARHDMWEVKSPKHGGRIFFMIQNDGNFVVSAVDKSLSRLGSPQAQAIRRGVKRWEAYLKQK